MHAGQFYVSAPILWMMFPYFHGRYTVNGTELYVSAGVYCYAVPMKTWSGGSEITLVTLRSRRKGRSTAH